MLSSPGAWPFFNEKANQQSSPLHNVHLKGMIAPPYFTLMSITNVAGINIKWFDDAAHSLPFLENALRVLRQPHYNPTIVSERFLLRRDDGTWLRNSPDSARYSRLIGDLVLKGVLREVSLDDPPETILPFFAVVKDAAQQTARPIENGSPLNDGESSGFSLPGALTLTRLLRAMKYQKLRVVHFDLSNYYFQIENPHPKAHGLRVGSRLFIWNTLTMGWCRACLVAQSLTMALVLRGATHLPEDVLLSPLPVGATYVGTGLVFCIYDSVMIIDEDSAIDEWLTRIVSNTNDANARLKYLLKEGVGGEFEYCGFHFHITRNGLEWKIATATLSTWVSICDTHQLPTTPRTLWKLLGFLSFAFTILCLPIRYLGLWRQLQSDLGSVSDWDVGLSQLIEPISQLRLVITGLPPKNVYVHRGCWKIPRNVTVLAFDATPHRFCVTRLDMDGTCTDLDCDDFEAELPIDTAESESCATAILLLPEDELDNLFILIGDNIPTLRAYHKASSPSSGIRRAIERSKVRSIRCPLLFVDVPSECNIADIGTRPTKDYSSEEVTFRRCSCELRAQTALREWCLTGETYFSRPADKGPMDREPVVPDDVLSALEI